MLVSSDHSAFQVVNVWLVNVTFGGGGKHNTQLPESPTRVMDLCSVSMITRSRIATVIVLQLNSVKRYVWYDRIKVTRLQLHH